MTELKVMLGMPKASDSQLKALIEKRGWTVKGNFAVPPAKGDEREKKQFSLSEERIDSLSHVVGFLEKQRYDLDNIKA